MGEVAGVNKVKGRRGLERSDAEHLVRTETETGFVSVTYTS